MAEKPILFSGPMVRALLDGRKTQTRRTVKPQPQWVPYPERVLEPGKPTGFWGWQRRAGVGGFVDSVHGEGWAQYCPYGAPGDTLWVRETWGIGTRPDPHEGWRDGLEYRADVADLQDDRDILPLYPLTNAPKYFEADSVKAGWRPSIHMPRWASRLTLDIVNVRVERVQDISEDDAVAEGFSATDIITVKGALGPFGCEMTGDAGSARRSFFNTFFALNTGRAPKDSNPWVWVIEFRPPGAQP